MENVKQTTKKVRVSKNRISKRQAVADWYASAIRNNPSWVEDNDVIQWIVENLSRNAFNEVKQMHDEQMSNLKQENYA